MTKVEPVDGDWVTRYHDHASTPWNEYLSHCADVEEVWQGQFYIKSDQDTADLEIKQPGEGRAIIKKMNEMLSIRANKGYSVARFSSSDQEQRACDRLERFCYAYENELFQRTQQDVFALAGTLMLIRGKVGLQAVYERRAANPKVRLKLWDPAEYFPVYCDDGIAYFTTEQWMYRWQLLDFFGNLTKVDKKAIERSGGKIPDLEHDENNDKTDLDEQVKVIQYWNEKWMAWCVEDTLIQKAEHGMDRMTLREARLAAAPFKNFRWSQEPYIGPIADTLKLKASMASKALSSVNNYYYPYILTKSDTGELQVIPSQTAPGETWDIGADGEVQIINPQSNQGELKVMIDLLNNDIAKMTLPDPAWSTSVGDESGFRASLTLNQIKDSVADVRNQAERCYGLVMGDVLYLHERFAPQGGWEYAMMEPSGRARIQRVTSDDIGEHQKVTVKITPALPQDLLNMITIRDMMIQRDPLTGQQATDVDTADEVTGVAELIGDVTRAKERKEWDMLVNTDEEVKALNLQYIKVQNASKLNEMRKEIEKYARKEMKREVAATEKAIEEGLTEDIVMPAEITADPNKVIQFAQLLQQGMMPQQALDAIEQGLPLGMPGEQVAMGQAAGQEAGQPSPETMAVMQQLMAGQEAQPTGMTGYEGVNPMAAPPAMLGAQPRQSVDQPALQVETMEQVHERGAKPPPR
jgi:hypothetical protein